MLTLVRYGAVASIVLRAGHYEVTFRPDVAMLCASLQYRGTEHVAWPRTLAEHRAGGATAIPLVHPWANRLSARDYRVAGRRVDLRGVRLPTDAHGLPLHGNLFGAPFDVVRATADRVTARFDYGARPDKLRAFPFPHVVTVDARVHPRLGLRISTEVTPTSRVRVPISFGWHPYLKIPRVSRSTWTLRWPACQHVEVDENVIPTGARTALAASCEPIARRTYDDHYALGRDRTFSITGGSRRVTLRFDRNYPFAQLYVPPRRQLVAIEPMTAAIDALRHGATPLVEPGGRFRATFTIAVERV